ncbi:MAG: metallophosphoesterase [Cytophagaceae bacterium]|nr:metallophosphoesterase [Cytophagaceae bacterium]
MHFRLIPAIVLATFLHSCQSFQKTTNDLTTVVNKVPAKLGKKGTLNFFVIGDWGRNGSHHQKEVAEQMNEIGKMIHPNFIISTGDNFYPNGVGSVYDKQWLSSFENIYTGKHLQCKWYAVLGNHDYRGTPQAELDYSKKSLRWTMPDRYYTLTQKIDDSTSVRFIFLDSNPLVIKNHNYYSDMALQDTVQQLKWLDSVLVHAKEKWKIVIAHHPVYSSNPRHGNSARLITLLRPKLEKYGVQLYLSGHDHDLQHQKPAGTVDYVISGAGSQTRRTTEHLTTKFTRDVSGFAAISLTSDSLKLYFIDYTGTPIYSFSKGK